VVQPQTVASQQHLKLPLDQQQQAQLDQQTNKLANEQQQQVKLDAQRKSLEQQQQAASQQQHAASLSPVYPWMRNQFGEYHHCFDLS